VEFLDRLYLRHGNGKVDRFGGDRWDKNVLAALPRKQVSTIVVDQGHLYAGQWGGWSEFDGQSWTHHLNIPELQGVPITALLPGQNSLWIGTQGKGLAEWNRSTGQITWHDERRGVPDDWVTCLAQVGDKVFAGTFVGGLAWFDGSRWNDIDRLRGENVTGLDVDGTGRLSVATRTGVWLLRPDQSIERLNRPFLDSEVQSIQPQEKGLWVGTRTGLFFIAQSSPN